MDTEYTEKTYGVDRFLLEGWFSIEEIEKLLVEMKGRVITPSLPAQRTWVGLTDAEINAIYEQAEVLVGDSWVGNGTVGLMFPITLYKMFEAKLKERNT